MYIYIFFFCFSVAVSRSSTWADSASARAAKLLSTVSTMAPAKKRAASTAASAASADTNKAAKTVPAIQKTGYASASMNKHMVKVHSSLKTIHDCPHFADVVQTQPLTIVAGGREQPYDYDSCKNVHQATTGVAFNCGGNFFWCDFTKLSNHRVPVNQGQIKYLQKVKFPPQHPPATSPYRTTVALGNVETDATIGADVQLQIITPIEIEHSILFSVADAINAKADDKVILAWKSLLLSWPMSFEVVAPGEPRMWRSANLREAMIDVGDSVKQTVRQRAMDVAGFKVEEETKQQRQISSADVAAMYASHLTLARSSERVSNSFVDCSITIDQRILSTESADLLEWCDENYLDATPTHPFTSIYVLQAVCDRGQTPPRISWAMSLLVDHYRMEFIDIGTFAIRKIRDTKESYINARTLLERIHVPWIRKLTGPFTTLLCIYIYICICITSSASG
jgi:hypothetical protein